MSVGLTVTLSPCSLAALRREPDCSFLAGGFLELAPRLSAAAGVNWHGFTLPRVSLALKFLRNFVQWSPSGIGDAARSKKTAMVGHLAQIFRSSEHAGPTLT